jgi:hypothetical protein
MITDAETHAMIDSLGDVGAALSDARPDSLSQLYQRLRLDLRYKPHENAGCQEKLSIPVDEDLLGGRGWGVVVGSFDEFACLEACAGADERDEVGCVHGAPAGLC